MSYKKILILIGSILFLSFTAVCQTTRETNSQKGEGSSKPGRFTVRRSSKKSAIDKDMEKRMKANSKHVFSQEDPHKDFEKRMKKVGRDNVKEERIMKKPQYSDPSYFGHKRKPKIRPVGKKKVCKECGLKH